jgi:hypothetical protein
MTDDADIIADDNVREKKCLERLAVAPIVNVLGVASARGGGRGNAEGDYPWTYRCTFNAWKLGAAGMQTRDLCIRQRVTDEALFDLVKAMAPYCVLRIRARVTDDPESATAMALLEEVVGVDASDPELNDFAHQLRESSTFEDATFGTFTLDRATNWYEAEIEWNGERIGLILEAFEEADVQESLRTGRSLWRDQSGWNARVHERAVQDLLPLKNDGWLEEGEVALTPYQFQESMTLESITVSAEGSFEFFFDDGDLFWGHSIIVHGSLTEGLTSTEIYG